MVCHPGHFHLSGGLWLHLFLRIHNSVWFSFRPPQQGPIYNASPDQTRVLEQEVQSLLVKGHRMSSRKRQWVLQPVLHSSKEGWGVESHLCQQKRTLIFIFITCDLKCVGLIHVSVQSLVFQFGSMVFHLTVICT